MFCVVYRFVVRPGEEQAFLEAWAETTLALREACGALGSRLHRTSDEREFVAYAQWPSREAWAAAELPPERRAPRAAMRAACEHVETLHELELERDLFA